MSAEQYRLANLAWSAGTIVFIFVGSILVGLLASFVARLGGASSGTQRKVFVGFAFVSPWLIGFFIFVVGPALASFYYSFTDYKLGETLHWIGLTNYHNLLTGGTASSRQFSQAMFNSLYYAIIGVPLQISAALGMAMLLNNELPGVRVFRTIFYLPVILAGGPAVLLAWRYMLGSNGLVDVALKKIAETFFVFGFLYRLFIYLNEAWGGFYKGVTSGDPVGPLMYTFPALIALLMLLWLAFGEWTDGRRVMAWRIGIIVGVIGLYSLGFRTLVVQPIDISWTYGAGIIIGALILINAFHKKTGTIRLWQVVGLVLSVLGIITAFLVANGQTSQDTISYVIALVISAIPIIVSLVGKWDNRKMYLVGGLIGVLCVIVLFRLVVGDADKLLTIPRYLIFQSAVAHPLDPDYLKTGFPATALSPMWIYGIVALLLIGIGILDKNEKIRRPVVYVALVAVALFTVSSTLDGFGYFHDYQILSDTATSQNFVKSYINDAAMYYQAVQDISQGNAPTISTGNYLGDITLYAETYYDAVNKITPSADTPSIIDQIWANVQNVYILAYNQPISFDDKKNNPIAPIYHFTLFRSSIGTFPGMDRVPLWMSNELWSKPSLILITMWSSGTGMLIFLAALKGVPRQLYEAAEVDGANRIQQFFSITLPMISPAMFYNIVIGIIAALQTFDTIYILQTPSTVDSIRSAAFFLYQRTFTQLEIGEGSAVSWILVVIILTVTIFQFRYSNWVYYEA